MESMQLLRPASVMASPCTHISRWSITASLGHGGGLSADHSPSSGALSPSWEEGGSVDATLGLAGWSEGAGAALGVVGEMLSARTACMKVHSGERRQCS